MLRVAQTTASTGRAKPSTATRSSRLRTTCSRIARPVDWSSTTMTVFRAEGRTRTSALAIAPPQETKRFQAGYAGDSRLSSKTPLHNGIFYPGREDMVPEERLELSWPCGRRILSPLGLPVPPFRPGETRRL